jgi:transcriptional antiterminator NusG
VPPTSRYAEPGEYDFEGGDVVRVLSGPFANFDGTISEVNIDQSTLKVLVNIFDGETPVELGFDQVANVYPLVLY